VPAHVSWIGTPAPQEVPARIPITGKQNIRSTVARDFLGDVRAGIAGVDDVFT
jgi:hypothetical protein